MNYRTPYKKKYKKPNTKPTKINFLYEDINGTPNFELLFLDDQEQQVFKGQNMVELCGVNPPKLPEPHKNTALYVLNTRLYLFSELQPHRFFISGMARLLERLNADQINVQFWTKELQKIESSRRQDIYSQIAISKNLQIRRRLENQVREEITGQLRA